MGCFSLSWHFTQTGIGVALLIPGCLAGKPSILRGRGLHVTGLMGKAGFGTDDLKPGELTASIMALGGPQS